ncbi:type II toxin-antitoxin system RelE/ParE family toxin [Xanthomonas campestris pv. campestris]|uniref:type II toxin-antitoxin system RelE/ParE family toxin n=1 Tax=Xanthomonas campestris TaxID=339 RepID=UPI0025A2CADF|nr:type II toxin-antitoxin system RelE/ParE family toxin [Xanthomonas campestris]MDM7672507.1 type II toxin-antitoxin system RelE/ParE family toxin [Xanthomonas campestris pv. campestris]MDM7685200.1 type II toxin-antitoxin system RelE/ParE family toxin [Xanthomonas campestris pv. campestris]MDM7693421.1 type II toxin-antitoxin system RelE/ParE family toxin [Xanthomonas campestris pv. campestris]MDM7697600.1 type II toxin-antitoxin system RelE/ParE family toxin [Xanthomonas campestris pv. campe
MYESDSSSKPPAEGRQIVIEKAQQKELANVPAKIRNEFLVNLEMALRGLVPAMKHEKLQAAGKGVIELKINGRPAYRCMYVVRKNGDVVVLFTTRKTTEGQDRQLIATTAERLKQLGPDQ